MAGFHPPAPVCVTKVELYIECRNLKNKDVTSKSDPCAVLFLQGPNKDWVEVGRTESASNTLNPNFAKCIPLDYRFEEVQHVRLDVYDMDNTTASLKDDDFLGRLECTVAQIVANNPFSKPLLDKHGHKEGSSVIIIRADEVKGNSDMLLMNFEARKLENKDTFGKSDPFMEISRATLDGTWQVIHRTEVVKNNLNPRWRAFSLPVSTMCQGDLDKKLQFEVFDWDSDGGHDLIGGFQASVNELLAATGGKEVTLPVIHPKKHADSMKKKKKYENSGVVFLTSCKKERTYSFLDFVFGGLQLNMTIGIDFTGSNGNPASPDSLHYINPSFPNEYMQAIASVGAVLQDYDSDKLFPTLGFGARLPPNFDQVVHEFAVNFNWNNPFCAGINGVLDAYRNCITQVQLAGPTNAAPIINHVARFAAQAQQEEASKGAASYYTLLLLTDGVLTDMGHTRDAIVQASRLPMSIIIVGVGQADFSDMNALDGDDGVLRSTSGQPVDRDIVQFVPFRKFRKSAEQQSAEELARHVLAELPGQVVSYFKKRGLAPRAPPQQTPQQAPQQPPQ